MKLDELLGLKLDVTDATATYAPLPVAGATLVYATEDQAVADANPGFTWLVLTPAEVTPDPDTTAPTVPTSLAATPGDGQVSLSWTASTDAVGVTGYRVYRDGVLATSPTGTSSIVSSLTNGTSYAFTVSAVDAAGNESAQTAVVNATPVASSDVTDPTAPTLTATDGDGQSVLTWTAATDDTAVTGYKVYKDAVLLATLGNVLTYTATGLTNGTPVDFTVTALDAAGNESVPSNTDTVTPVAAGGSGGATEISDDFENGGVNSTTLGADLTWTEYDAWSNINNQAQNITTAGAPCARAEADVTSVDHWFEIDTQAPPNDAARPGVMGRFSATAETGYVFWARNNLSATYRIAKVTAGTVTTLATGVGTLPVLPATMRIECNGSTIRGLVDGVEVVTFTDPTPITTGTRGGIFCEGAVGSGDIKIDAFRGGAL